MRYAWLPKGIQGVQIQPDLFTRADAPVVLGVGKNMVRSIRHWCLTLGMIDINSRSGLACPSELGNDIFAVDGWDPYLEDIGTIWLLHWLLVRGQDRASTWHLAFTRWNGTTFSRDRLVTWLLDIVRDTPGTRATPESIRRDVEVFVRSYVPARPTRDLSLEDTFDSPLVELGLIEEAELRLFLLTRSIRPSLPAEVFAFSLLDFWQRRFIQQQVLSFEAIFAGPGSPGSAFKLTENALAEQLEKLPAWTGLSYDETAGTRVVLRASGESGEWQPPIEALRRYYDGDDLRGGQMKLWGVGTRG